MHVQQALDDQNKLLESLTEYEELFDGTLGDWKTEPISYELKEALSLIPLQAGPSTKSTQRNNNQRIK